MTTVMVGSGAAVEAPAVSLSIRNRWPTQDWLSARDVLAKISGLDDIFAEARMMRLFRSGDEVGGTLASSWLATGAYAGAQRG